LCVNTFGAGTPQGNCNENQFSQPFTAPDGTLYVTWANFNNATGHPIGDDDGGGGDSPTKNAPDPNDNHNQILLVKSTDGGQTFGACNNDILLSISNNGGQSFTGGSTNPRQLASVNQDRRQATSDQWFQWATFTKSGRLAVSYYDRQYSDDETTGFSDFSLSGS